MRTVWKLSWRHVSAKRGGSHADGLTFSPLYGRQEGVITVEEVVLRWKRAEEDWIGEKMSPVPLHPSVSF